MIARRDWIKLVYLFVTVASVFTVLFTSPYLASILLCAFVLALLFSRPVAMLERKGLGRTRAVLLVFAAMGAVLLSIVFLEMSRLNNDWESLKSAFPRCFMLLVAQLKETEEVLSTRYPFLGSLHYTEAFNSRSELALTWLKTQNWGAILKNLTSGAVLVPFVSFAMLTEGRNLKRGFLQLVPNRWFESAFLVIHEVTTIFLEYLFAKLTEVLVVSFLTILGLELVHCPFAPILGICAGVFYIIPYFGPFCGAIPGIMIAYMDLGHEKLVIPVLAVYIGVGLIDLLFIFPEVVAKQIKLHPLVLTAAIMLGQQHFGIIGMFLSVPVAAALKVVIYESYDVIYQERTFRVPAPLDGAPS